MLSLHTVLLLQVKLMVVEFVTDMVTTMVCVCQCGRTEVCTLIRGLLETRSSNQRGRSLKEPPCDQLREACWSIEGHLSQSEG